MLYRLDSVCRKCPEIHAVYFDFKGMPPMETRVAYVCPLTNERRMDAATGVEEVASIPLGAIRGEVI